MLPITRIKAPKYRVGRYVINEYELRNMQLEVVKGLREPFTVTDESGAKFLLNKYGTLKSLDGTLRRIVGWGLCSGMAIEVNRIVRKKLR